MERTPKHNPATCGNTQLCPGCKEQERLDAIEYAQGQLNQIEHERSQARLRIQQLDVSANELAERLTRLREGNPPPVEAYTNEQLRAAISRAVWSSLEGASTSDLRDQLADLLIPDAGTPREELLERIAEEADQLLDIGSEAHEPDVTPEALWLVQYIPEEDRPSGFDVCALCLEERPVGELKPVEGSDQSEESPIRVCKEDCQTHRDDAEPRTFTAAEFKGAPGTPECGCKGGCVYCNGRQDETEVATDYPIRPESVE